MGVTNAPYTILWSVKTGGVAASEPIVRDGLVFFSGLDRRIEIFELSTGQRLFRKRFDGPVLGVIPSDSTFGVLVDQMERRYITYDLRGGKPRSSFRVFSASAAPRMLSDSTMLVVTWQGRVMCVTADGDELWTTECEGAIKSAPAVHDTVVFASAGHSVFALNESDGAKIWEHGVSGAIEGAPAVDDHVYFGAADSFVTALDPTSGSLVWTVRVGGGVYSTPTIGPELLYVASNDGYISALNKRDGRRQWSFNTGAVANLSPTLCGEYLLATSRQSAVTVLDARSGDKSWSDTTLKAQAMSSPVVVGDRIILTDARRNLICLAPATQSAQLNSQTQ
jgi:outer membrane protein assembly factor BamB